MSMVLLELENMTTADFKLWPVIWLLAPICAKRFFSDGNHSCSRIVGSRRLERIFPSLRAYSSSSILQFDLYFPDVGVYSNPSESQRHQMFAVMSACGTAAKFLECYCEGSSIMLQKMMVTISSDSRVVPLDGMVRSSAKSISLCIDDDSWRFEWYDAVSKT